MTGLISIALLALTGTALADHDMVMAPETASSFGASVSLIAARYDSMFYLGDYEGVTPALDWTAGRFSAMAMVGFYRLLENGRTVYGPGDAMPSATARLYDGDAWHTGLTAAATMPIGDQPTGLGMGHVMIMPSAWFARDVGAWSLRAEVGYNRALTNVGEHDHGLWPLVDPMNMQEVSWAASIARPLTTKVRVAARAAGGIPFGLPMGVTRAMGAARVTWGDARFATAVEVQVGIAGAPFDARAILQTTVRL